MYKQCGAKQKAFFCYTSGLSDTVTPKCPKCGTPERWGCGKTAFREKSRGESKEAVRKTHQVVRTCQQQKLDLTGYIYRSRNDSADTRKLE